MSKIVDVLFPFFGGDKVKEEEMNLILKAKELKGVFRIFSNIFDGFFFFVFLFFGKNLTNKSH